MPSQQNEDTHTQTHPHTHTHTHTPLHTHTHTHTYKKGLEDNVPSLKGFNIVLGLTVYQ